MFVSPAITSKSKNIQDKVLSSKYSKYPLSMGTKKQEIKAAMVAIVKIKFVLKNNNIFFLMSHLIKIHNYSITY